jgi:uncharacterized protein with HEPN domain
MLDFAGRVLSYTEGFEQTGFVASGLTYDATLRNLELLSTLWSIIQDDVPELLPLLRALKNRMQP